MTNIEQTIFEMLVENTGTHMLDSGGANGRAWQRNQGMTLEKFKNQPSAYVEINMRDWKGKTVVEMNPCVDVFHLLTGGALRLCSDCKTFNALPVEDWNGDFWGVSSEGQQWLDDYGFEKDGDGFNTYNWASNHSQVLQGQELVRGDEKFVLLQIHGGADVRGGYTNAKLFKLNDFADYYNVLTEDCGFSDIKGDKSLNWYGEWITECGSCATDDDLLEFATACGVTKDTSVVVYGDAYLDVQQ